VTPDPTSLTAVYQEVCKGHGAIADFRAKLLALLPIASAGGIGLLFKGENPIEGTLAVAIGVFGFVVTFGLFMYELRGVKDCVLLRGRAKKLETAMNIPPKMSQFADRQRGDLGGLVDEIGAGWIIYPAVMAAWAFVATHGAHLDDAIAGPIIAVVYLAVVIPGVKLFRPKEEPEEEDKKKPEAAEPYKVA
jgi:hypothetical protein